MTEEKTVAPLKYNKVEVPPEMEIINDGITALAEINRHAIVALVFKENEKFGMSFANLDAGGEFLKAQFMRSPPDFLATVAAMLTHVEAAHREELQQSGGHDDH